MSRQTKRKGNREKRTNISPVSHDGDHPIWIFTQIDKSGDFSFDIRRIGDNSSLILDKIINYSSMTWGEIQRHTHDDGRSKHHFIRPDTLSSAAIKRLEAKELMDQSDNLYSFAFTNLMRIIGIRDGALFKVLWYDPEHKVCPSIKKHT